MLLDDGRKGCGVQDEQDWSQDRTLGNTEMKRRGIRRNIIDRDILSAVLKVRREPLKSCRANTKDSFKTRKENRVIDSVKGSRVVEKKKKRKFVLIQGSEYVINNTEQNSFSATTSSVCRLKRVAEVVRIKVRQKLTEHNFLQNFRKKWEIRNRSEIFEFIFV
jgi:hypothetical protein